MSTSVSVTTDGIEERNFARTTSRSAGVVITNVPAVSLLSSTSSSSSSAGCRDVCANFSDLFRRPLFWVVYFHLVVTMGTALLWVNQAGSFTAAAVGTKDRLSTMVILFSLGNVGGRLAAGVASDFVELRMNHPRSVFLTLGAVLMGISLAVLAASPSEEGQTDPEKGRGARFFSAMGVGVAEGTIMAAWTAIVRKAFGAHRFGRGGGRGSKWEGSL